MRIVYPTAVSSLLCAAIAASLVACGGGGSGTGESTSGGNTTAGGEANGSGGEAGANAAGGGAADADVRALVTELLTPQLCPKLIGSFIGLPGEGSATGPAAGTIASAGRWWIRSCDARVVNDRLSLSMGGPGWTWVDRETSGFRVHQYMLFEASVELSADVAVGYDRERRIASVWMRPATGVSARITPRGVVSAEPTGFFSAVLGGVLSVTGSSASDRARAQAEEVGSQQMQERLATGFTMTMSLDSHQTDFMVGALERGQVPERPWPSDTTEPWLVNARSTVWPGGLDVVGPIDTTAGPVGLDVELEEGEVAQLRTVCAEPMGRYFDARLQSPDAPPTPPAGTTLVDLTRIGEQRYLEVPRAPCPTLLLIAARGRTELPVRLRYRVAPPGASPLSHPPVVPGAATTAVATPSGPTRPARVRIRLVQLAVAARNARNLAWDVVGGEADPYVVTVSVPRGRELDRSQPVSDRNVVQLDRWLPGALDTSADFPLRFTVYDEDSTNDELVGAADLDATGLPTSSGDVTLAIRTTDAVPVQLGVLRLRIEPAQ